MEDVDEESGEEEEEGGVELEGGLELDQKEKKKMEKRKTKINKKLSDLVNYIEPWKYKTKEGT